MGIIGALYERERCTSQREIPRGRRPWNPTLQKTKVGALLFRLRSANMSPLKVRRCLHLPLAKIARSGPPRLVLGVSSSLLVYILLRLESLHQAIHVVLLVVRSSCQREF